MKINNFFRKNSPYRDNSPRVRNSYYTFSREYPAGNIPLKRRIHLRFRSKHTKNSMLFLLALVITAASFFGVRLMLDISYKAPDDTSLSSEDASTVAVLQEEGLKALYMPYENLGDSFYIRSFIRKIERKDCNAVVIDFKTESGKLCFSSLNTHAINSRCAIFDNNTVRKALSLFKKENIAVVARIFCFLDNTIPAHSPGLAVKYMNTDVNWIDTTMGEEGKTWLNPCSKDAQKYLLDIIGELRGFSIDGFILEKCHFPDGENMQGATYPGLKGFKNKNAALTSFISLVRSSLDKNEFLIIAQTANDALDGNKKLYSGSINSAEFDAVAAYTLQRPETILLDKKTDFAAMLGLFSSIESSLEDKAFIPIIDFSEYSRRFMRTVKKSRSSFILFDATGRY